MPRIEWVTFDCYGTLVDWETGVRAFLAEIAAGDRFVEWERAQRALLDGPYRPYREIMTEALRRVVPGAPPGADARLSATLPRWPVFPDTAEALRRIRTKCKVAIVSNIDRDLLEGTVEAIGVPIDARITAEDARAYKPNPAVFRHALHALRAEPASVLHVAFGFEYDIGPAKSEGIRTMWVNRKREKRPPGAGPDREVGDLAEAAALIVREVSDTSRTW